MGSKEKLRAEIKNSGLKICYIAQQLRMSRPTLYKRLNNPEKLTGEQMVTLSNLLRLSQETRNQIFFG